MKKLKKAKSRNKKQPFERCTPEKRLCVQDIAPGDVKHCRKVSTSAFMCTREESHEGPCVACACPSGQHNFIIWTSTKVLLPYNPFGNHA